MNHVFQLKCQAVFSWKIKIKMSSAAIVINTLRVKIKNDKPGFKG